MAADLSARAFTRFYAPLAATSLLLTATNPLLAAALARTADPATALAGYSVAFALTGVLYAPLLVVQQVTATRLLEGGDAGAVRRLALAAGVLLSAVAAAVAYAAPGDWIFGGVVGVSGAVHAEARSAMGLLWPVPLLTGIRALHQGRLVAGRRTHPIAVATGVRTGVLAVVAFALAGTAPGARVGAAAFTAGLVVETLLVMVAPSDRPRVRPRPAGAPPSGRRLVRFSVPLVVNVLLWWSTPLVINAVLARTPEPDRALAAFAVVEALAWFVTAPVGQLQHASIALVEGRATHVRVRSWAGLLSLAVAALLGIVALPWVREPLLWLGFRLDGSLLGPAGRALPLTALYPLLYGHRQYYQGLFVRAGNPGVVGWGAALRVAAIVVAAIVLLDPLGRFGAAFGVGLAVGGLVVEGVVLERFSRRKALSALERRPAAEAETVPG
ncbi:MAG TPA: hypothetical protein VE173_14055 [Longimicrobiales bacterium]|nr:hypothetical protein [Longimicrobiales bacterium]